MMKNIYAPHEAFIAPARPRNALILLVFGFFSIEFIYRITYDLLDVLMSMSAPEALDAFYIGATPLSLAAQLFSFAFLAASTALIVFYLHHRNPLTLFGHPGACLYQFRAAVAPILLFLLMLEFVPPWWSGDALDSAPDFTGWVLLLPISLSAILVQISAEELLYRGYLQQQLAALFSYPPIWLILTNLIFGFAHWSEGSSTAANVQYVIWAFFMGLCASDLTARSGTLGPALAFHFANNAFAFLLYGETGGQSSGFALFLFPPETMGGAFEQDGEASYISWQLILELFALWLMWLSARIGLRR